MGTKSVFLSGSTLLSHVSIATFVASKAALHTMGHRMRKALVKSGTVPHAHQLIPICAVSHRETSRFARQNGLFYKSKRAILQHTDCQVVTLSTGSQPKTW